MTGKYGVPELMEESLETRTENKEEKSAWKVQWNKYMGFMIKKFFEEEKQEIA